MRAAIERVEATHVLHLAGLQTPTCRANPILGATVNVIGTLAIFEAAVALKDQVQRVVYASSAAVHGPAEGEASGPLGDEVRLAPLTHYGAFKVCNELNARVYWLDQGITSVGLRPWTVYGVGRDFGMTSEPTKAIKAVAAGPPLPDQLRRPAGPAIRRRRGRRVPARPVGALRGGRRLQHPRRGRADRDVRGHASRGRPRAAELVTHGDRQLPIAPDLDDSRLEARLGPLPRTSLRDGIAETFERFRALRSEGRLDLSDLE